MKQQVMNLPEGRTIADLAHAIETVMISREGLETQVLTAMNGDYVIQGRSPSARGSQWVGLDKNLTIHLSAIGERGVYYKSGCDRWLSKGALAFTGTFIVAWPLAVTATIGMVRQKQMADRIARCAALYLAGADEAQLALVC